MSDGPTANADFARALTDPRLPPPAAIGAGQARRFAIYRNNTVHGMTEALRATFPAVERLVGGDFFAGLARAFLEAEPPVSPLLFRYGGRFAAFIEGFPPAASVPYLGDIARLEWLRLQAYHAADATPIGVETLAALPPEALFAAQLTLHPSLGLVRSRYPAFSIWAAASGASDDSGISLSEAQDAVILRPHLEVTTTHLPSGGGGFLANLSSGASLGQAAAAAAADVNDFDLSSHIGGVFAIGAVIGVIPGAPSHEGIE